MHGYRRSGQMTLARVAVLGVAALMLGAGSAGASVTITSFHVSPSTTTAGGHPDLTVSASFSYSDSTDGLQGFEAVLPAGLLGNPSVVSKCSSAQLSSDTCPAGSKIGTTSVTADAAGIPVPVTATGDVYSVTPTGSEPARIGMVVRPVGGVLGKFSISGPADIRIPGDYGLNTTFTNLPRTLPPVLGIVPIPITITSISLTLDGLVNGGTAAFMTNPTSCLPAASGGVATSYESPATPSGAFSVFYPTDCANEPFSPAINFAFGSTTASTPSALTAAVSLPGADLPRRQSHLQSNVVILPIGTSLNPGFFSSAAFANPCTDAQFNVNSAAPAACPAASQIGTVAFTTPLLGTLPGQVYFATGTTANPLRQFIQLDINGKNAKLIADNSLSGPYIITVLSNLPQTPFTNFALSFTGGPNALVQTPPCGSTVGIGGFFPWSGNSGVFALGGVTISQTSTGSPCP